MKEEFKLYEKSIKRIHKFAWKPKYSETIKAPIKPSLITYIAKKIIEELEWDLTFLDDNILEAKASTNKKWTEKIVIEVIEFNSIKIESSTLEGLWDLGRNVKRVKLFIFAFQKYINEIDQLKIETLEKELIAEKNLTDYIIPEKLSQPNKSFRVKLPFMIFCTILISTIFGFAFAELLFHEIYKFILSEIILAVAIGFIFARLIRVFHYFHFQSLFNLILTSIITTYFLSEVFFYCICLKTHDISFINFLKLRYSQGIQIGNINLGIFGWIIYWLIKITISYFISNYLFTLSSMGFLIKRIPVDVIDFALYHLQKGKDIEFVKIELFKKGWTNEDDQEDVINAIGSIQTFQELRRQ